MCTAGMRTADLERHVRVACAALAVCACSNDPPVRGVRKPAAPVMQPLLDAYAAPTAAVTADTIAALALGIAERITAADALQLDSRVLQLAQSGLMQVLPNAVATPQALTEAHAPVALSEQALTVEGDGYLVVTRICDGWGPLPVPDPANGEIALIVGFTELGVDPVIWGAISACRYRVGARSVQVDGLEADPRAGDVRVFVGRDIELASFGTFPDPVLVDVNAQVLVDGVALAGRFSFRVDVLTRALEVAVPLGAGHVLAAVAADRPSVVQVRALNGVFVCDTAAARCTTPTGETIGAP
jgi:hypothetical protein